LPLQVLLVEDDELDARAVARALDRARLPVALTRVGSGEEALTLLLGDTTDEPLPSPRLMVLDLNLPGIDGHELLDRLRADARLRQTVAVVLTTSDHPGDVRRAYERNAAAYLVKGLDGRGTACLMGLLRAYTEGVLLP
jgi:CheY-like chemotaxis protein